MPDTSTHSDAMKEKRRLFACNYVCLGSVREAVKALCRLSTSPYLRLLLCFQARLTLATLGSTFLALLSPISDSLR